MGLWFGTEEAREVVAVENDVRMHSPAKVEDTGNKKKIKEDEMCKTYSLTELLWLPQGISDRHFGWKKLLNNY